MDMNSLLLFCIANIFSHIIPLALLFLIKKKYCLFKYQFYWIELGGYVFHMFYILIEFFFCLFYQLLREVCWILSFTVIIGLSASPWTSVIFFLYIVLSNIIEYIHIIIILSGELNVLLFTEYIYGNA